MRTAAKNLFFSIFLAIITITLGAEIFLLLGAIKKDRKNYFYQFIGPHSARRMSPVGIWENDPLFGYAHIPNARGTHQTLDFSVTYHIGPERERVNEKPGHPKGRLLFLGCSWTFGHGVDDHETYPAILADHWRSWQVLNKAVMGWGTVHAYQLLSQELKSEAPPDAVIYGMHDNHVDRNYIGKKWLGMLARYGRSHPHYEIVDGRPEFQGIVTRAQGLDEKSPGFAEKEIGLTVVFLKEMNRLCREKDIPFVVLLLHANPPGPVREVLESERIPHLDLTGLKIDEFPNDEHPNVESHKRIADAIQNSFVPGVLAEFLDRKSV